MAIASLTCSAVLGAILSVTSGAVCGGTHTATCERIHTAILGVTRGLSRQSRPEVLDLGQSAIQNGDSPRPRGRGRDPVQSPF
jgi:hypothetical protein